jgi:hypothetical protein
MGRKPYESDFEVEVFDNTIAVRFWPTRSLYTFRPFHHRTGDRRFWTGVARPCHSSRLPQRSQASIRCSRSAGDGVPACDGGSSGRDVSRGGAASSSFLGVSSRGLPSTPRAPPCSSRSAPSKPSSRGAAYDVRDANGHALAFVYSRDSDAEARQAKVAVNTLGCRSCLGASRLTDRNHWAVSALCESADSVPPSPPRCSQPSPRHYRRGLFSVH